MSKTVRYGSMYRRPIMSGSNSSIPVLPHALTAEQRMVRQAPSLHPATVGQTSGTVIPPGAIGAGKLLIVMQFYPGDQSLAVALSKLVADLEPIVSPWADWAFLPRFDCRIDTETVQYMCKKFSVVHVLSSERRCAGWPKGPNAMAMDLFRIVHEKTKAGEWAYDAILMAEGDCLPLRQTWIKELLDDWHSGNQMILGAWFGSARNVAHAHVNGNLMFSPQLPARLPEIWKPTMVPVKGWDSYWFAQWAGWSRASRLIYSDYRLGTPRRPWPGCEALWQSKMHKDAGNPLCNVPLYPAWLHGIKLPAGLACVRRKFGI